MSLINNKLLELMTRLQAASAKREEGQGLVEYALILALVSVTAAVALGVLSGKINGVFSTISNALGGS